MLVIAILTETASDSQLSKKKLMPVLYRKKLLENVYTKSDEPHVDEVLTRQHIYKQPYLVEILCDRTEPSFRTSLRQADRFCPNSFLSMFICFYVW